MPVRTIDLPWRTPPLNENQRLHWRVKANLVRDIRTRTAWLARAALLPRGLPHVTVWMHVQQPNRIRRDAENAIPTFKACCDGLVDHGVVKDDTPTYMDKRMPVLHPPVHGEPGRLWLEIVWGDL